MKKILSFLLSCLMIVGMSNHLQAQPASGLFESSADIGKPVIGGESNFMPESQQYVLSGSGYNVWFDRDECHYHYRKIKGDFLLYARASLVGTGVDPHRKLGWMARQSLEDNSAQVSAVVHGDGLTALQYRLAAGDSTAERRLDLSGADVIQLERKGDLFTMRAAIFGDTFKLAETRADLGEEIFIGLFVSSHNVDVRETGLFKDVRITVPAPDSLVAYRQYIGSDIEILNPFSGERRIVYSSGKSLQAPNWTIDGKELIYNSDGLIHKLNLDNGNSSVMNTGSVKNNNNDHVLSFDGKWLGLSSGVQSLGGSVIYTVPIGGGEPKQVTPRGPSYLHGWSPDGKFLVFTGQRNSEYDIYRIPVGGGKEERLTTAKGLDDGPEYSPDGKYIYFNSNRNGTMQIWRMLSDGSQQEAITNTDFHDWFPHISPDGKWIVFLSFLKNQVKSDDHPFYKHVYIRMMPATGGQPKVIAYLYGGQGTINTPSWSPDSKRIAFVSNTMK